MSLKFVLALSFFCCLFLEPINGQEQEFYDREYEKLKRRDRYKAVVPLPTRRPQNPPQYNQQNQQNQPDRNNPQVPQPTPRPQTQPPYNPQYPPVNNNPHQQQQNQPDTNKPQVPQPTPRPQNNPQLYLNNPSIYSPLYYIPRLEPNQQQQYQQYYHHTSTYTAYQFQQYQLRGLNTPKPNLGAERELNTLAGNIPDNRRPQ